MIIILEQQWWFEILVIFYAKLFSSLYISTYSYCQGGWWWVVFFSVCFGWVLFVCVYVLCNHGIINYKLVLEFKIQNNDAILE